MARLGTVALEALLQPHSLGSEQPDAIYLTQPADGEVTDYSWSDVNVRSGAVAGYLESLNFPAGIRIALGSQKCAHLVSADLAVWMIGHVSVPVYPSLNADTLRYMLEHSESSLLFWVRCMTGVPCIPACRPEHSFFPGLEADNLPSDSAAWEQAEANASPPADPVLGKPEDVARLVYTFGSTGRPKSVMIPFRAMAAASELLSNLTEVGIEERMISYLLLAHVFEAATVLNASL